MSSLNQALRAALDNRQDLLAELHAQSTDCYRLFHGSQEGAGGLTIDRYGQQIVTIIEGGAQRLIQGRHALRLGGQIRRGSLAE